MARKTFNVAEFVEMGNARIKALYEHEQEKGSNEYNTAAARFAIGSLIEAVLCKSDTYAGFTCLTHWDEWEADRSLVQYYPPKQIR